MPCPTGGRGPWPPNRAHVKGLRSWSRAWSLEIPKMSFRLGGRVCLPHAPAVVPFLSLLESDAWSFPLLSENSVPPGQPWTPALPQDLPGLPAHRTVSLLPVSPQRLDSHLSKPLPRFPLSTVRSMAPWPSHLGGRSSLGGEEGCTMSPSSPPAHSRCSLSNGEWIPLQGHPISGEGWFSLVTIR